MRDVEMREVLHFSRDRHGSLETRRTSSSLPTHADLISTLELRTEVAVDRVDAMMLRRVWSCVAPAAVGAFVLGLGCSTTDTGSSGGANQAPLPELASYDRSCALDSDCAVVLSAECAPCSRAALSAKDAPRYSAALVEAQKTETCQRQIERSAACLPPPVVARCASALCVLAAAPLADAGKDASLEDGASDASSE